MNHLHLPISNRDVKLYNSSKRHCMTHQQVGVVLSTVSWLPCAGDSAPRAPPATDEAVVPDSL